MSERVTLSGFGRSTRSTSTLVDVEEATLAGVLGRLDARGAIARGLGRSYGDPAQNGGGHVLRLGGDATSVELDTGRHELTVDAGVSLDQVMAAIVPRGYFVPVTPGTRYVTVGGAIASDIHGKNHHCEGSFGNHVTRLRMMLADTTVVEIGPDRDPELFWATIGGMGLTGVILDASIRLIPIETDLVSVDTYRLDSLDEVMSEMAASEADFRYSVAWLDLMATGEHLGRGVLTNGEHAPLAQLPRRRTADPLNWDLRQPTALPPVVPPCGLINRLSVRAFNEMWFRKSPRIRHGELQSIPSYFHPLDGVVGWNRVYGHRGFVQYQFVVPDEAVGVMRTVIEQLSSAQLPIFLTVLKRFGPANPAPLSFPAEGWQLAVDIGAAWAGLAELLASLDRLVLDAGGRHYLAKDGTLDPESFRRGYPRLAEWQAVRHRVDPTGVWASDQSRRLRLT